ncbi:23S rRNA m(5)U1939 methyltransferase [Catenovulum agarivorans DS-2]|uniref:23S rRNA m(5)U1939 methyltransferase n=1 Tax=Catenovulum agarivorans DS-2 TaxID=1328313 RepID=W7QXW7_9ALTE|nr:23S rRNA (uracil(1939)-C(5))-methyltransferase RlmD [Catenovulum agarivorans]EWH10135.1 23S rRNA m(5)U1939 methyltransferase [Catenovulum agarivorans DS-2]
MVKLFSATHKKNTKQPKAIEVIIDGINHQGHGVARHQGKVCFVEGALPGETWRAKVVEDKKHFIQAQGLKCLTASADRQTPPCKWAETCGGCQLQHMQPQAQITAKQSFVEGLFSKVKLHTLPWQTNLQGDDLHYRNRVRLAAWYEGKQDKLHIGFRQKRSKKLVAVDRCLLAAKPFETILSALRLQLDSLKDKKYVQHVELHQVDPWSIIVLRVAQPCCREDIQRLTQFSEQNNCVVFVQSGTSPALPIDGVARELSYSILGLKMHFELADFIQVNHQMNQQMIEQAISWLDLQPSDKVLDLFCGSGNFSLPISQHCQFVAGIEGSESAVQRAQHNAQTNQLKNCQFSTKNLAEQAELKQINWGEYDKILLDPSRDGAALLCQQAHNWQANSVLYIACDANSLVRDSQFLDDAGYKISKIALVDMFPHTAHVETMALFKRV